MIFGFVFSRHAKAEIWYQDHTDDFLASLDYYVVEMLPCLQFAAFRSQLVLSPPLVLRIIRKLLEQNSVILYEGTQKKKN